MMNDFDITAIKDEVIRLIRSLGISKKVYPNRPKATEPAPDFVVVSVIGTIVDKLAYGECTIGVSLFAKDLGEVVNDKKLSHMYQKFIKGFPASSGRLLFDTEPNVLGDTPDDFGFHARLIRIKTTIKGI